MLTATAPAHAHAALRHATPAAGAIVDTPLLTLTIEFSQDIDLTQVELTLHDITGTEVAITKPTDEANAGTTITRTFSSALKPGTYEVKWRVLSTDGHHTRGTYTFEVKAGEQR